MSRSALKLLVLLIALSAVNTPAAGSAERLSVEAVLDGIARAGELTQLRIQLFASHGGPALVELVSGARRIQGELTLTPDALSSLELPVVVDETGVVAVRTTLASGEQLQREIRLQLLGANQRLVIDLGDHLAAASPTELTTVKPIAVELLPSDRFGYAPVDAIVASPGQLGAARGATSAAIREYLRGCGRLLLVEPTPEQLRHYTDQAGCGGSLIATSSEPQMSAALNELLQRWPPELPDAEELYTMSRVALAPRWWSIAAGLTLVYIFGLLWLARRRATRWLVVLPVVVAALIAAACAGRGAEHRLFSWAEAYSGATTLRYASLLQIHGRARSTHELTLPLQLGWPHTSRPEAPVRIVKNSMGRSNAHIALPSRLLSQHTFTLHGTIAKSPPLALLETGSGPLVENISGQTIRAATMWWRGLAFRIPELAADARWQPDQSSVRLPDEAVERIVLTRLPRGSTAVLVPYTLADAGLIAASEHLAGWLLVRAQPGISPS